MKRFRLKIIVLSIIINMGINKELKSGTISYDVDYGVKLFNLPFLGVESGYSNGIIYQKDLGINAINTEGNVLMNYMSIPGGINTGEIVSIEGNAYIYYVRPDNWQSYVRRYLPDGRYTDVLEYEYGSYPLSISGKGNRIYTYSLITIPKICYDPEGNGYECYDIKGLKTGYDSELNRISREIIEDESLINGSKDYKISEDGKIYAVGTEVEPVYEGTEIKYKYALKLNINGIKKEITSEITDPMTPKLCVSEFIAVNSQYAMIYVTYCNIGSEVRNRIYTAKLTESDISFSVRNSSMNIRINEEEKGCVYGKKVEIIDESIYSVTSCSGTNIIQRQDIFGNTQWYIKRSDREAITYVRDESGRIYTIGYIYNVPGYIDYMDRYIEVVGSGYKIYKDTTTDVQVVAIGERTKPFVSIVKNMTGNSINGIRLSYETNANWIEKWNDITSGGGISSNTVMINQVPPYEYSLTAICNECIPESSSVTFTCCGKLKTDEFKQNDDRWKYELYNTTTPTYQRTIGEVGCALTSMATLINYYAKTYPGLNIPLTDPEVLNEILKEINGFDGSHNVDFKTIYDINISKNKLKLYKKFDFNIIISTIGSYLSETDALKVRSIIDNELTNLRPVIIKVYRAIIRGTDKKEWSHFMLVVGKCGDKYIVSDPGSRYRIFIIPFSSISIDGDPKNIIGPINGIRLFEKTI